MTDPKKHECPEFSSKLGAASIFNWSLENRGDGWYMYNTAGERSKLKYNFCPICGEKLNPMTGEEMAKAQLAEWETSLPI